MHFCENCMNKFVTYSLLLNNLIAMSWYLQDTLLNERRCKTMISTLPFVLFP